MWMDAPGARRRRFVVEMPASLSVPAVSRVCLWIGHPIHVESG